MLLTIAVRNLLQHRRRTLLLGGAIAGVTALLIVLLGLFNGMQSTMLESATTLMTGHVNVGGFYKSSPGQAAPIVTRAAEVVALVRREVPEVDFITQRGRGWAKLISDTGSMQVGIGGLNIEQEPGFRKVIQVVEGDIDSLARDKHILIFEEQAKKLDVRVGDALTLSSPTPQGTSNTLDVVVGAVARNVGLMSAWNIFMPEPSLRELYQLKEDTTGAVMIYLEDVEQTRAVQSRLRSALEKAGYAVMEDDPQAFFMKFEKVTREDWTQQKLDVTAWEDEISFMRWTLAAVGALTLILTVVLLVIIAVGLMSTMWIAIRERTREIGTLRAIGMKRGGVLRMFLAEGVVLAFTATVVGALTGLALCAALNASDWKLPPAVQLFVMRETLFFQVEPAVVVLVILFISGITAFISLIPSFFAGRLRPVTAMQHAG